MFTATVEAADALPEQPEIVIGDSTVVLSGIWTSAELVPGLVQAGVVARFRVQLLM